MLAMVIGSIAKISRTWDRSLDARAISSPVVVCVVEREGEPLHVVEHPIAQIGLGPVRQPEPEVAADPDPDSLITPATTSSRPAGAIDPGRRPNGVVDDRP